MTAVTAATQVTALLDVQSAVFRDRDERNSFLRSLHRVAEATDLAKEEAVEARRVAELEASLAAQKKKLADIQRRRSELLEADEKEDEEGGAGGGDDEEEAEEDRPPHVLLRSKHVQQRGTEPGNKRARQE